MNQLFLKHAGHMIQLRGGYGQVEIKEDERTNHTIVTKRAIVKRNSDRANEGRVLTLSKEFVLLKFASSTGVTPKCIGYKPVFQWIHNHRVPLVKEICMEFTGPTLQMCNYLGFLLEPTMLFKQLVQACVHLQELGILHLDLKPDNVTYDLDQQKVKVIDLGLGELTGFQDMAIDCGIQQWSSSPYGIGNEDIGQVKDNGMLNKYVPAGTLYFQNSFTRPFLGQVRCKNAVNIIGFRDPAYMCCEALDIARGIPLEGSTDIFAVAMIVLTHAICQEIVQVNEVSDCSRRKQVIVLLQNISYWRGCCSHEEVIMMERILHTSAYHCERSLSNAVDTLYAIRSALAGGGPSRGLHAEMSSSIGQVMTSLLLDCIHPVPCYRPIAKDCLTILNSDEEDEEKFVSKHHNDVTSTHTKCLFVNDGNILIGQAFMFPICVVSVSIKWRTRQVLWQKLNKAYFAALNMQRRRKLAHDLVKDMHIKARCCRDVWHAASWFKSLSREEALVCENDFLL